MHFLILVSTKMKFQRNCSIGWKEEVQCSLHDICTGNGNRRSILKWKGSFSVHLRNSRPNHTLTILSDARKRIPVAIGSNWVDVRHKRWLYPFFGERERFFTCIVGASFVSGYTRSATLLLLNSVCRCWMQENTQQLRNNTEWIGTQFLLQKHFKPTYSLPLIVRMPMYGLNAFCFVFFS